jgi:RNA polymerase sigma-70 factor (ECF subfamily)
MGRLMANQSNPESPSELLRRAAAGDASALGQALEPYRRRLRRMIALRIDRRLQGRVDPSDVVQEAYIDAARRIGEYTSNPSVPFYLWLRVLAGQRLVDQYRRHLGAQARDVAREFTLYHGTMPEATSAALAAQLLGRLTTPSETAFRAERRLRLQEALNQMEPIDREILALRHFEQLTNGEAAAALMLDKSAASKRYARALVRLKDILRGMPGGGEEL